MARAYCNFSSAAAKAAAGKDIIVGVFTTDDVLESDLSRVFFLCHV